MGSQFIPNSIPRNIIIMKFLVVLSLVASAIAPPIAVTPDVAKATEEHLAAHAAAAAGEHAALAPAAVVNAYLDDAADVAAAKAEFQKAFDLYASGAVPLPTAPVFAPAATVAAAAPVAPVAAPLYNGFYGFPHLNAYGGYGTSPALMPDILILVILMLVGDQLSLPQQLRQPNKPFTKKN